MNRPRTPSADERLQLTEHLFYEVQMTFDLIVHLVETWGAQPLVVRNALVESFTIHIRQLVAFLWEEDRGRATDAFAADYFAPGEWAAMRPARPAELDAAVSAKVGWGVAHITYGRALSAPADKEWRPVRSALRLLQPWSAFSTRLILRSSRLALSCSRAATSRRS